jgi:hypothetical protein
MISLRTLTLLTIAVLLGACTSLGGRAVASPTPTPRPSSSARSTPKPSASGDVAEGSPGASPEPETVTVDDLIADAAAYDGREVVLTATAEREVSPSAWLVGGDATADETVLMLDNSLHPVGIERGKTFDIHARVEKYVDPASMTKEVGGLPDMYNDAFTTYEGSYVLVASAVATGTE